MHGGDRFHESVIIDAEVEKAIEELGALAPLHNRNSLEAYRFARERLPGVPQVAVFDTAFHQTLPPRAYVYGLPYEYLTDKKIRRYGFHGISHRYVLGQVRRASRQDARRLQDDHLPSRQRLFGLRDRAWTLDRHVDGLHAAGRSDHGDTLRRYRCGRHSAPHYERSPEPG